MHRTRPLRRPVGGSRLERLRRWLLEEPAGPSPEARTRVAAVLRITPPH